MHNESLGYETNLKGMVILHKSGARNTYGGDERSSSSLDNGSIDRILYILPVDTNFGKGNRIVRFTSKYLMGYL
jgi:hypothetical protein